MQHLNLLHVYIQLEFFSNVYLLLTAIVFIIQS